MAGVGTTPASAAGGGVDPVAIKDGTNATQKLAVDATGKIGINNFPATQPVSGTVTVNQPVAVTDNGGSLTVDGTVDLSATSLTALESITVQNGAGAAAVNIQDGGNSITVDGALTATISTSSSIVAQLPGVGGTPDSNSLWSVFHTPASNTQATVTKSAPGAGKALVITSATFSLAAGTVAPLAVVVTGQILGATSGTLYGVFVAIPNTAGANTVISSPITLQGADNEALTVRFSAAAGINTNESVQMNGYVVTL